MVKNIELETNYGYINLKLKSIIDKKGISINELSRMTMVKYDIVKKYYYNENYGYNADVLAKFCYVLECNIDDIIEYKI